MYDGGHLRTLLCFIHPLAAIASQQRSSSPLSRHCCCCYGRPRSKVLSTRVLLKQANTAMLLHRRCLPLVRIFG